MPAAVFKIPFFSPGSGAPHVLSAKAAASDAFNPFFMLSATDPLTELATVSYTHLTLPTKLEV